MENSLPLKSWVLGVQSFIHSVSHLKFRQPRPTVSPKCPSGSQDLSHSIPFRACSDRIWDRICSPTPPMQPSFLWQSSCSLAPIPCWKQQTPDNGLGEIVARCWRLERQSREMLNVSATPCIISQQDSTLRLEAFMWKSTLLVPKPLPTSTNL